MRIGKEMTQHGKTPDSDAKEMWAAVRQLTGRQQRSGPVDGITAESLNDHYATISSDVDNNSPIHKSAAQTNQEPYITEFQVFSSILD